MILTQPKYMQSKYYLDAFLFFLISGGALLVYSKLWGVSDRSGGNLLFQVVSLSIYGWAILKVFSLYKHKGLVLIYRSKPLFALILICVISISWSVEPLTSFRRAIALCLTYGYCIYLVCRYELEELLYISLLVCIYIAFFGVLAIAIPGWGIDNNNMTYSSAIRGLAGHKNDFGRYIALACLICFHCYMSGKFFSRRVISLLGGVFLILLILSESKTSLAVVFGVVFFTWLWRIYVTGKFRETNKKMMSLPGRLFVFSIVIPIFIMMLSYLLEYALGLLGKDLTFTGRTSIWLFALDVAEQQPWFGAGYRAFWTDALGTYTFWGTDIQIGNGHNGFIDVYLEMGCFGLFVFACFLFSFFKRCMLNPRLKFNYIPERIFVFTFYFLFDLFNHRTNDTETVRIFMDDNNDFLYGNQ